jgi:hypothetical protein
MDDRSKIERLFELGHFFNPKYPNCHNVTVNDLAKLTFNDVVVREALTSFQHMMGIDLTRLGEMGPSEQDIFEMPRCGHPDYEHPALLAAKVGTGSWPEPCQKAGVTFSLDKSGMPSKFRDTFDEQILKPVIATYAKIGLKLVPYTGTGRANIRVAFVPLLGSTIGLAEFNNRSCGDSVFCHLDTGFAPNEATEADLLCHEMGHNMNLNHTRGGVMNPSLSSKTNFEGWIPSDPSYNTLVRFFGGEPVDNPPGPGPGPTPKNLPVILVPANADVASLELNFTKGELNVKQADGKIVKFVVINNNII